MTVSPYDQLTSNQILDVQSGAGGSDVFDYLYFGLADLVDAGALTDLAQWIDANGNDIGVGGHLLSVHDAYTLLDGKLSG